MKTENNLVHISDVQRFCMHDGPGIRTTVFFAGCPLRCEWCHNPEAQSRENRVMLYSSKCIGCSECVRICTTLAQIVGETREIDRENCISCGSCVDVCPANALENSNRTYTLGELSGILLKDKPFYADNGGVTLSGGEPLFSPENTLALLAELKKNGVNTAIESSAYCDRAVIESVAPYTDLFMWDFKLGDGALHKKYTGVSNEKIKENIRYADSLGVKSVLRCIMIKGINMNEAHYRAIADLFSSLENCEYVELLPYHTYGTSKYDALGITCNPHRERIPSEEDLCSACEELKALGVKLKKQ